MYLLGRANCLCLVSIPIYWHQVTRHIHCEQKYLTKTSARTTKNNKFSHNNTRNPEVGKLFSSRDCERLWIWKLNVATHACLRTKKTIFWMALSSDSRNVSRNYKSFARFKRKEIDFVIPIEMTLFFLEKRQYERCVCLETPLSAWLCGKLCTNSV